MTDEDKFGLDDLLEDAQGTLPTMPEPTPPQLQSDKIGRAHV